MKRSKAILTMTIAMHHSWCGLTAEDYINSTGEARRPWNELPIWRQDEIIYTAETALDTMQALGMLPPLQEDQGGYTNVFELEWESENA